MPSRGDKQLTMPLDFDLPGDDPDRDEFDDDDEV